MKSRTVIHVTGAMNMGGTERMLMTLLRMKPPWKSIFLTYGTGTGTFDQEIKDLDGEIRTIPNPGSLSDHFQLFRTVKPAAVHAHTLFQSGIPLAAARAAGVPIRIAHAHTTADPSDKKGRFIYEKLMRASIALSATDYRACSSAAGNYLFAGKSFEVMPNLFDPKQFKRPPEAEVLRLKLKYGWTDKLVLGSVGRLTKVKNHAFMLDMLSELHKQGIKAVLLVVGDGDQLKTLRRKAEELSVAELVTFTGAVEDPSIYYHLMDVFLMPSLFEGLGIAALEAQASLTPVLGSEALQPEADLGGGLLYKLPLEAGSAIWAEKAISVATDSHKGTSDPVAVPPEEVLKHYYQLYRWKGGGHEQKTADYII